MSDETQVVQTQSINDIVLYSDVRAELLRLEAENEKVVFDYEDPKQNKAARSHIYTLRSYKGNVERERKRLKADALAFGRKVDSAAKELTARLDKMISVHQEPIDRIAQREAARVEAMNEAVAIISRPRAELPPGCNASVIADAGRAVKAIVIDPDVYQERMAEATKLKADELELLRQQHAAAAKAEAEAAELERLRQEKLERERKEREARIAAEAAEKARLEAEAAARREREAAEAKAKAEREAALKRERDLKEAADRAEREAREREERMRREHEAVLKRQQEDARRKAEAEAAAREAEARRAQQEQERREANKRHVARIKREAAECLHDLLTSEQANTVISRIVENKIKHVSISF